MPKCFDHIPFSPASIPFFYGWVVLAMGTVGILASIPGQTMGVSVFTDHLIVELGMTREHLSLAYMAGTIGSAMLLVPVGGLVDRAGVRATITVASFCLGLSLLAIRSSGTMTDALRSFMGDSPFAPGIVMAVCFLGLRFFGQGIMTMAGRVMVGRWFERRRGLATAISGIFTSFGFTSAPTILSLIIETFTWRGAYLFLAVAVGVGMTLIGALFYRERPEDSGLKRDGGWMPKKGESQAGPVMHARKEFTRKEALRTYEFWVFSAGLSVQSLVGTAMTFHIMSISGSAGLPRDAIVRLLPLMSLCSVTANFFGGWLSDKIRHKYLLLAQMAFQMLASTGWLLLDATWGRAMMVVGFGTSGGLFVCLAAVVWPRMFGTKHLGAISGLNMAMMVFASAVGPYIYAFSYERTESYASGIKFGLAFPVVVFVAALFARNPQEAIAIDEET